MSDGLDDAGSHGERQRRKIMEAGIRLWRAGPEYVTARRVAEEAGMSHSNVLYHFQGTAGLKNSLAYYAIKNGDSVIIMHLIAERHPSVANMTDAERLQHMQAARSG